MLRSILLLVGFLTFSFLIWHIGPGKILDTLSALGPGAILVILLPSLLMYVLEAYGWRLTLGEFSRKVSFLRLLAIRTAGEVVNMTTPTAYVGGEPLKAYLLKRDGVPLVQGLASVVTAKTVMTIAQVGFILLGMILGFWLLRTGPSSDQATLPLVAAVMGLSLLAFGVVLFVVVQRHGLFTGFLRALRRLGIRLHALESREEKFRELDRVILDFYATRQSAFIASLIFFFAGWMAEALEVYAILAVLGGPADFGSAIAIGGLSVFIKGGTFFIPGSLGAQEGGNLLVLVLFGYSDVTGITFALLRRVRELVWIAVGLACLGALGGRSEAVGGLDAQ